MRRSKEFIAREIAGENILIPSGKTAQELNGMISVTPTARFIWEHVEEVDSIHELVDAMLEAYDVDRDTALEDAVLFVGQLLKDGYVELTKEDQSW